MKPISKIVENLSKSVGASGFQFFITLFSTPIMTRLYAPEHYATFSILNGASALLIGIGMLSLPIAYTIEKESSARIALVRTMILLLAVLVTFSALLAIGVAVADALHVGLHISSACLILFPLLVLTCGIRQIVVNIAISKAHFNITALAQMIEPICARGGAISLGVMLGGNPVYMLFSVAIGQMATIATVSYMTLKDALKNWRNYITVAVQPITTIRRYLDFAFFNTASQQVQSVVLLVIQMIIAAGFSAELAGHYILAVSILSLPATMIALATAPVVYRHLIEVERTAPLKLLPHLLIAISCYLIIGFIILLPIFLFGEEIFRFAFGKSWGHAGTLAEIMSIAYVGAFAAIGVQSIFGITRRLKMHFILEVFSSLVVCCVIIFCFKTLDFDGAIRYLAIALFLRNILLIIGCIIVAFQHQKGISVISK